ncbi:MAG: cell division protein FtsQ/DivIB [Spirochaetota bacterium]
MADLVMNRGMAGRTGGRDRKETKRNRAQDSERTARILLLIIAVLALIVIAELAFHFIIAPELTISRISLESEVPIANGELLDMAGVRDGVSYFSVDTATVAAQLREHPSVRAAEVEKVFPNRLDIRIAARKPLMLAFASGENGTVPVAVDKEGVLFEMRGDLGSSDLPLVSGIRFEDGFSAGTELPGMLHEFLGEVQEMKLNYPAVYDQISEYRIVPTGDHTFDVVLYPVDYDTPVRVGSGVDGSLCEYIIMVLDAFERDGRLDEVDELDFRSGEIVFRTEED